MSRFPFMSTSSQRSPNTSPRRSPKRSASETPMKRECAAALFGACCRPASSKALALQGSTTPARGWYSKHDIAVAISAAGKYRVRLSGMKEGDFSSFVDDVRVGW